MDHTYALDPWGFIPLVRRFKESEYQTVRIPKPIGNMVPLLFSLDLWYNAFGEVGWKYPGRMLVHDGRYLNPPVQAELAQIQRLTEVYQVFLTSYYHHSSTHAPVYHGYSKQAIEYYNFLTFVAKTNVDVVLVDPVDPITSPIATTAPTLSLEEISRILADPAFKMEDDLMLFRIHMETNR